jgi:hypothetical protein
MKPQRGTQPKLLILSSILLILLELDGFVVESFPYVDTLPGRDKKEL